MGGMNNPNGTSILEHALEIAALARPLVEAIQRKDRDLASQVRRAVSSIALNLAESQGNAGGNTRVRLGIAWGYLSQSACAEVLTELNRLGGRVFGMIRR